MSIQFWAILVSTIKSFFPFKLEKLPVGARIPDPAIAATLSADIAVGLVACSQVTGKSIREDVAMMDGQFHIQKGALGAKVLRLNKEKGWLIPPPLHLNNFIS